MESNSTEWHSESVFYYPYEIDENSVNTGNTDEQEQSKKRPTDSNNSWLKCNDFIEYQRPENTKKKLCTT